MVANNLLRPTVGIFLIFFVINSGTSRPVIARQTTGNQSPLIDCPGGSCTVNYSLSKKNEIIGKKLALRSIYLIPFDKIKKRFCDKNEKTCSDTFEVSFFYLEIQNIWPEPILLTAGKASTNSSSNFIHMNAGMFGCGVLAEQITATMTPKYFLLQPGEIKYLWLSRGVKLDGLLDFFNGDILDEDILDSVLPFSIYNLNRVDDFNRFLQHRYGKRTYFRIELFEKNYQSLLRTDVFLGQGGDMFIHGRSLENKYKFKHDALIGEILYQLKDGKESFSMRSGRFPRSGGYCGENEKRDAATKNISKNEE